ncbi:hypothetical protein GQ53DRAFT_745496 [Thozetella sp. PMI_491]|nr:hypothetical protein GQ53DRAFT_745496 [Thozetella sp. PMI_491]
MKAPATNPLAKPNLFISTLFLTLARSLSLSLVIGSLAACALPGCTIRGVQIWKMLYRSRCQRGKKELPPPGAMAESTGIYALGLRTMEHRSGLSAAALVEGAIPMLSTLRHRFLQLGTRLQMPGLASTRRSNACSMPARIAKSSVECRGISRGKGGAPS